jgi:hypothetical protein
LTRLRKIERLESGVYAIELELETGEVVGTICRRDSSGPIEVWTFDSDEFNRRLMTGKLDIDSRFVLATVARFEADTWDEWIARHAD